MIRLIITTMVALIAGTHGVNSESKADETNPKKSFSTTRLSQEDIQQIISNPAQARAAGLPPITIRPKRVQVNLTKPDISVKVGAEKIVDLDVAVPEIVVTDPKILTVEALSKKSLKLSGRQAGITKIKLKTAKHGEHVLSVIVYGDVRKLSKQLEQIEDMVMNFNPSQGLIHLSGIAKSQEDIDTAVRLAQEIAPRVINNLRLDDNSADSSLKANGSRILVHCNVLEFQAKEGSTVEALQKAWPKLSGESFHVEKDLRLEPLIKSLAKHGSVKILAEPTIVTLNKRKASFRTGYEIRIPVEQLSGIALEHKHIGAKFDVTPKLLGEDSVQLQFRLRLSSLAPPKAEEKPGDMPRIKVLELDTSAKLKFGQSLISTGLAMRENQTNSITNDDNKPRPSKHAIFIVRAERAENLKQTVNHPASTTATKPQTTVRE